MFYQLHHILYKGDIYATPHTNNSTHFATSSYLVKNLALLARSSFNCVVSRNVQRFWSTGVLECWEKPEPQDSILKFLHYSITPPLHYSSRLPCTGKTVRAHYGGGSKSGFVFSTFLSQISPPDRVPYQSQAAVPFQACARQSRELTRSHLPGRLPT